MRSEKSKVKSRIKTCPRASHSIYISFLCQRYPLHPRSEGQLSERSRAYSSLPECSQDEGRGKALNKTKAPLMSRYVLSKQKNKTRWKELNKSDPYNPESSELVDQVHEGR
jgi:hypothetical protein